VVALRLGEERGEPLGAGQPWVLEGSAGTVGVGGGVALQVPAITEWVQVEAS